MSALLPFTPLMVVALVAYLIGSLSFGVIVSRVMGLDDPRSFGSGNPGATNVLRSGHKTAALLTLLGDAFKGWLPVWGVRYWGGAWGLGDEAVAWAGLGAFLGHLWPVFFRFAGGKGVATALGVLLGVHLGLGVTVLLLWLGVARVSRYSSLAAIVAAALAPGCQVGFMGWGPVSVATGVMSALLVARHHANIRNLWQGTERRIGQKAASTEPAVSEES